MELATRNRNKIFLIFIALNPILDIVYTLTEYYFEISLPINQGIRVLFILYLLYVYNMKKYFKYIGVFATIIFFSEIVHLLRGLNFNLISNMAYSVKVLSFFIFILVVYKVLDNEEIKIIDITKAISISVVIICLGIILPTLMGLGLNTYGNNARFGFKGLFNAQNAITATLLIQLPIVLYAFMMLKKRLFIVIYLVTIIVLSLIGTKVGIVGAVLILFINIIFYIINIYRRKIRFDRFILTLKWISGTTLVFIIFAYNKIKILLYSLPYNKVEFPTFFSYLVSNRDAQVKILHNYLINSDNRFLDIMFGVGYTHANKVLQNTGIGFQLIEMDLNGIYYYSGILLLLLLLGIFSYGIYITVRLFLYSKNYNDTLLAVSLFIGIVHSVLGGHVLYEAITNFYLAIVFGIIIYKYKSIKIESTINR